MDCMACGKYTNGQTVPAHANWHQYGKGGSLKAHDCFIAAVCTTCHDWIDGKAGKLSKEEQHEMWHAAWLKTVAYWFSEGVVKVK
jgi:ferredoxin